MNDAKPNINVTPLIDVLLVLLIIFMVVSPLKPSDIKTKVPQAPQENKADVHPHILVVSMDSESSIKLNNIKENLGNSENTAPLIDKLIQIFQEREKNFVFDESGEKAEKTVFIKAPRDVAYGRVVKIVDAVKIAGADPISLQTDDLE